MLSGGGVLHLIDPPTRRLSLYLTLLALFADLSEKKSDLRVCDDSTCRFGGVCRDDGAQLKCVCQFQVGEDEILFLYIDIYSLTSAHSARFNAAVGL